jgi:lysophospholipase L1-like esterase
MRLDLALSLLLATTIPASGPAETLKPLNYVVLGDSTAAGVGADYEAGIAASTERELGRRFHVTMVNLAVSGAQMEDVRERQLPTAVSLRPDVVLLSAGANDVTHLTSVRSMRADLRAIVEELRAVNPDVKIVVTGSPDMGSPPRIPRVLRALASHRTQQVNEMFQDEARENSLVFAPIAKTTGPLFREDRSLFADDEFHPNARGYATWVPVLNQALAIAIN